MMSFFIEQMTDHFEHLLKFTSTQQETIENLSLVVVMKKEKSDSGICITQFVIRYVLL